jgi:hypothetical protein
MGAHARSPALRRFARLISRSLTHDLELRGLSASQARRRYWGRPEAQFVEGFPNFSANDRADLCGGNVLSKQPHRGNSTLEVGCLPTGSTAVTRHWPSAPHLESDLAVCTANSARAPANHASTDARELATINVSLTNLTNRQGKRVDGFVSLLPFEEYAASYLQITSPMAMAPCAACAPSGRPRYPPRALAGSLFWEALARAAP